ncbi:MIP/aquaporin family protein [Candidatus Clostridium radicumherbarum]|uniref:MIP/aquaporin family protein n=1 Tax=Candidatus Clostridium radicumherbarum TaxID=3381662 RepID=A0ABW8TM39_9CLOT
MSHLLAECLGTMIIVLFGDAVVGNVVLNKTKGNGSGWIVITTSWAIGVALAVYIFGPISGGHFNPAVTIALASLGKFAWADVPGYIIAQMLGGFIGGVIVWINFRSHWEVTDDKDAKLGVFCTGPAIRNYQTNFISEVIATFILMFGILGLGTANMVQGFGPLTVGLLIFGLGLSYGGTTGYAMNPARDLGPRLSHFVLPVAGKRDSDWAYSWIPVLGPICGALLAALVFHLIF